MFPVVQKGICLTNQNIMGLFQKSLTCTVYSAFGDMGHIAIIINKKRKNKMGKFTVKQTQSGIKFDLRSTNGRVIATSEVYESEAACMKGIESVKKNCIGEVEDRTVDGYETVKHPKFELYTDRAGEFRFRLKATNGQVIAASDGYKTKVAARNAIDSVKNNAPDAEIVIEKIKELCYNNKKSF